jgi:ubiquinone/menaquinone biosynthesis C-methylase UbiE
VTDTKTVQRLFDGLASEYDQYIPFFATFGRELVAWCDLQPGQRVLDIAAGRGAVAAPAARAVGPDGEVLAIDTSPNMLRALSADHPDLPQLTTLVMDAYRLELPDACFDVVTCGLTFHLLDDPPQAIAEAHRVLRPGGLLAFSVQATSRPQGEDREAARQRAIQWAFYWELMKDMAERRSKPDPLTFSPSRPLPEICAETGFTGIEQRNTQAVFTMRDPQHYWDWSMSHGSRSYVDSLGPELAGEFRARMLAGLERMHANGGITVDRPIVFYRMRKV